MIVGLLLAIYFIYNEGALKSVVSVGFSDTVKQKDVILYQDTYIIGLDSANCKVRWISTTMTGTDSIASPCMPKLITPEGSSCLLEQDERLYDNPLWIEYCKNRADWLLDCDRMEVIVGRLEEQKSLFSANFCVSDKSKMIGFMIPDSLSTLPLYHYAVNIDSLEKVIHIDLFNDVLSSQDEAILESKMKRLIWSYQPSYYKERLQENKVRNEDR